METTNPIMTDLPNNETMQSNKSRPKNTKLKRLQLNAKIRSLTSPKSPLMIFKELFSSSTVELSEELKNNLLFYTAKIKINDQTYTAEHINKNQAQQLASEKCLRDMLDKKLKICEPNSEIQEKFDTNGFQEKPKPTNAPPSDEFPWPHFASLAMYKLMIDWNLIKKNELKVNIIKPKVKPFPENPEKSHPLQMIHEMVPNIKFTICENVIQRLFVASAKVNDKMYFGKGSRQKEAKKECAISIIKDLWNFDYHTASYIYPTA